MQPVPNLPLHATAKLAGCRTLSLPQEPAYNAAYKVVPLKTWVNVQFGKEGVVWVCGNAGAFSELGGSGYGTCDTKYKSIEYFLTTSDAGSNYKDTQFFGDAVVLGVSLMQANPGLVSFWNNLEASRLGGGWAGPGLRPCRCAWQRRCFAPSTNTVRADGVCAQLPSPPLLKLS